jgi:protein gp37
MATTKIQFFVNSMGDLFHEEVPFEWIDLVMDFVASSASHTFMVLTKRPQRMAEYFARIQTGAPVAAAAYERRKGYSLPSPPTPELRYLYDSATTQEGRLLTPEGTKIDNGFSCREYHWRRWPLSNLWLGVSVEDQQTADERIPILLRTPAALRFVSCEPLLGPVRLEATGLRPEVRSASGLTPHASRLDWVIAGGENGPEARPAHPAWFQGVRDECAQACVPFFFKGHGSASGLKSPASRLLDDRRHEEFPTVWTPTPNP